MISKYLTIVIPAKNEEKYIGNLIDDIATQYLIDGTKVVIAVAESSDNTLGVIEQKKQQYKDILQIIVTKGGTVSVARNNGSEFCDTRFICFIDADVRFFSNKTILHSLQKMLMSNKRLLTCKLKGYSGNWKSKLSFRLYNIVQWVLSIRYPFAIGAYFFIRYDDFLKFDKFSTDSENSEDFLFSQNFKPNEFITLNHFIGQDDRRFKKLGYIGMLKFLITNLYNYIYNKKIIYNSDKTYF